MPADVAAGAVLVQAGGRVTDVNGEGHGSWALHLASNGLLHGAMGALWILSNAASRGDHVF